MTPPAPLTVQGRTHDEYIAMCLSWGRPALLQLTRSLWLSAGRRSTVAVAELLWHHATTQPRRTS